MNTRARMLCGFLAVLALVLGGAFSASQLLAPHGEGDRRRDGQPRLRRYRRGRGGGADVTGCN